MNVGDKGFLVSRGPFPSYHLLEAEFVGYGCEWPEGSVLYFRALEAKGSYKVGHIFELRPSYAWQILHATRDDAQAVANERRLSDLRSREAELRGLQQQIEASL